MPRPIARRTFTDADLIAELRKYGSWQRGSSITQLHVCRIAADRLEQLTQHPATVAPTRREFPCSPR